MDLLISRFKIYSATQSSSLNLDMLDRKDKSNIKYKRMNEKTGKEVAWENSVNGYMLKDKYLVLEDADFEDASQQDDLPPAPQVSYPAKTEKDL
ncbi:Ku protein [Sphingobacterium spiritivorum]|uniref:Ku protein n=1 Tax=Sphingobacterium spiritivorum TaxID=258 RepID=A0A380C988_SPHSI|nr:Ku protein [Sphingobacterium spiritivorum]